MEPGIVENEMRHEPHAKNAVNEGRPLGKISTRALGTFQLMRFSRSKLLIALEILIVIVWTLFVMRPYLDLNATKVPAGREFLSAIQTHQVWENAKACGNCALWFGNIRGGFPAFVDPVASVMHPLVIAATMVWGVINGSKMALVGIFLVAGLSQWWLGYLLGLRRVVRIWSAMIVVVGGHLAARMNLGAFSLVISTASASMVFPAIVYLAQRWSRRAVGVLAIVLAVIAVGGTGYIQVGLVFTLPAAIFLAEWNREQLLLFARRALQTIGLAIALAGPFLIPFLHFLPNIHKDFDISFSSAQPLVYAPFNLVIRDLDYYMTEVLGKPNWPAHFVNYIGWIPVLLATLGLFRTRDDWEKRVVRFLFAAALLGLWTSSAGPLALLIKFVKINAIIQLLAGVRYTSFIGSLAVPPILGLAAIGLDRLLDAWDRRFQFSMEGGSGDLIAVKMDIRWLLVIPLWLSINQAKAFTSQWITTVTIDPPVSRILSALKTDSLQWVNVPFGEHYFVTPAVTSDLKLSVDFFRTWHWKEKPIPVPYLEANRAGPPEGMTERTVVEGIHIHVASEGYDYARVVHADGSATPCQAYGTGGHLNVFCQTEQEGVLIVQENSWSGWRVWLDDEPIPLQEGVWLTVAAPSGDHSYFFRYQPWDVKLGLILFAAGVIVSAWVIIKPGLKKEKRA